MESVRLPSKYQVVIPRRVRESLELQPGQKMHVLPYENRIELIPGRPPGCAGCLRASIPPWRVKRTEIGRAHV